MDFVVDELPPADLGQLEPLWHELLAHHLTQAPHLADLGRARTPADSWRWLAAPRATVLVARNPERLLGYAMVHAVDDVGSWQFGDQLGVLETLVVSGDARGARVGRALMDAARQRLAGWGIQVMTISVIAGNEGALRFYRREGADEYMHTLIMPVAPPD